MKYSASALVLEVARADGELAAVGARVGAGGSRSRGPAAGWESVAAARVLSWYCRI